MFKFFKQTSGLIIVAVFFLALAGCDKISNTFGKNEEPKKAVKVAAPQPAAAQVAPASTPVAPPKDVLAQVGDWMITLPEFNERLKNLKQSIPDIDVNDPKSRKYVLDEIVRQQLLVMEAEKMGVDKDKNIMAAVDDFRRTLLVQELVNRKIKDLVATSEDAKKYYEENKDKLIKPVEWKVREILVLTESAAKENLAKVLQGADFAELAKITSKSKSASNGGELEPFTAEKAPFPEMLSAISILNVGGVSAVFKGPEGFYIVKVDEKQG